MRPQSWTLLLNLALLAFTVFGDWASCLATSFIEQPFPDTVQEAPIIVRGKVGKTSANWGKGADGGKRIYTFNDLDVQEVFKGHLDTRSIVIRELGGEKDGIGMQVAGTSYFEPGEDVVVLLSERNSENSYEVRGLMMGKYNLKTDASGKEYLVGPGIPSSDTHQWTLEALREVIQTQANPPAPSPSQESQEKDTGMPSKHTVPPSDDTKPSASQLQNSFTEGSKDSLENPAPDGFSTHLILALGLGALGLGAFALWAIWRRRR